MKFKQILKKIREFFKIRRKITIIETNQPNPVRENLHKFLEKAGCNTNRIVIIPSESSKNLIIRKVKI